ncbi:hypothetical protein sos41_16360 [Alphaproteobacteria bacterium SO-S41]|nr:hypothetical protein sos41_16360 [Alphaproteobacteria bacterium SO-S41]
MVRITNFARGLRGVRVFWQCEEIGLPYEVATIGFPYPDSYKALNPAGGVPFLEDEGGVGINESVAIMLYLAERYGPTPLLPAKDDPAFAQVLQLTVYSEATIGGALNTLMATHFMAPDADKKNWTAGMTEGRVAHALGYVAGVLGDKPFLVGDELTLADIAIGTALGMWQGALGKVIPAPLDAYRERLRARPAYQRAMAKQG